MARRYNELFIGKEYLSLEGRSIKHPALFKTFASLNANKISDTPIDLIGLDLETNHLTAELKLLGFYDNDYRYYTKDFLQVLFSYIKYASRENKRLAYWNRLDPFVIFKQFLYEMNDSDIELALQRYGKISGEWNKADSEWEVRPVTSVIIGNYEFGIKNVIRSSIQFYYYHIDDKKINYVWAYDIAALYHYGLEKEAQSRLDYYSKVDKSAHLVNWERFDTDKDYRENIVLKSNELDARAVKDLGIIIQKEFKTAFNYYPKTLISQGSLARASIIAKVLDKYKNELGYDLVDDSEKEEILKEATTLMIDEVKAIGLINYYDKWLEQYGDETLKEILSISAEAYSGGYIEAIRYGFTKEAYYSDLASAYPAIESELYDLRGSKITKGTGEPPHIDKSYCFIRGIVDIPEEINFHSITIKHPIHKETNIRASGVYRATYTIDERDYLISIGAKFSDESWINIETTGKLSPLAEIIKEFIDLRNQLKAEGNSAEYMAKIAANSTYGILFEATDTYEEQVLYKDDKEVLITSKAGYRVGEFFNSIYAAYITARTRLKLARAANEIEFKGGKVILLMTDSVFWEGKANMLPEDMIREKKTLGYFEPPEKIYNLLCLGSGRYGYETEKGYYQAKKRGLNATSFHDPQGIVIEDFSWYKALKSIENESEAVMSINVRSLVSVGMILGSKTFNYHDLGKVIEQKREVDLIVGHNKRMYDSSKTSPKGLLRGLLDTKSIYIGFGMLGTADYIDQTLPMLREKMFLKECKSTKDKKRQAYKKGSKKYYKDNKENIKNARKEKYRLLRDSGFTSYEANKMVGWSSDKLMTMINLNLNKNMEELYNE